MEERKREKSGGDERGEKSVSWVFEGKRKSRIDEGRE